MKNIIRYLVKHEVLVNLSILLMLIFGLIALSNIGSSFFPQQETQFILVEATFPGASPEEVEKGIVLKVEDNLQGITGIDRVKSTSQENFGLVEVELETSADENVVLQEVKNAVDRVSSFPTGMEQIVVFKQEEVSLAGKIALSGDVSLHTLKDQSEQVENELRLFEEISRVSLSGFPEAEIEIELRENDMRRYGLTFADINEAVASENIEITGGRIRGPDTEYIIRADKKSYYAKGLRNIVVKTGEGGAIVRLKDVAHINDTFAENTDRGFLNGEPAVFITVNSKNNEDILLAAEHISKYVENFNKENAIIKAALVEDGTKNLRDRIDLLQENGLLGGILVLILLGMFLRIRLAFWVALGIPISFCGMFILALYYGLTINVISLFGMIIVIGILVDDGIVVGENIYQKYEEGFSPMDAAIQGTLEVIPAIVSAITTTVVAFSFFYFIPGQLGEFFSEVAFVVSATLVFSLIEVFLFLPAHLAHSKALHKENKSASWQTFFSDMLLKARNDVFIPSFSYAINHKILVVCTAIAVLVLTVASIQGGIIRTTFFPEVEQDNIGVTLELKRGTNENITLKKVQKIEQAVVRLNQKYREKFDINRNMIERRELILGPSSHQASATYYLMPAKDREIRSFDIAADIREETGPIPEAEQLSFSTFSPFGKPVVISLTSPNFEELKQAAEEVKNRIEQFDELTDIVDTQQDDQPEVHISLKEKARVLGLSLGDIMAQVRDGFFGNEIQRLQRGENEIKVWTRYDRSDRTDIGKLLDMRIRTPEGGSYPLNELAHARYATGLVSINHRDGRREIRVEAELSSIRESTPAVLEKIRTQVMPDILAAHPTVDYIFEGQYRETQEVSSAAQTVLPVIVTFIFALIVFTFRSTIQALALFLVIPFGMIGVGWGHYIHGAAIGILSMLGIIALIGIIVNDGLVLITTFNNKLRKGMAFDESLIATARDRFRPILLTTGTTAAGLAPLIFEKSFQAQFLIPMAISVAYGLIAATFLLLVLLPLFLIISNDIRRFAHWLWEGEWLKREEVEPAVLEKVWEEENK